MKRALYLLAALALVGYAGFGLAGGDAIHFSHGLHGVDMEMACADCHMNMAQADAGERSMPDHDTCVMCHEEAIDNDCGYCHVDGDNPVASPAHHKFEKFSHKTHHNLHCNDCHGVLDTSDDEVVMPEMADCVSCHDMMEPLPLDHRAGMWVEEHGLEAAFAAEDCAICHTQASCDDCHQGTDVFGSGESPHPPTYMFDHYVDASYGGECLVCHESYSECVSCHRSMIPTPHEIGPMYANNMDGGDHVEEVRAFPETCLACHDLGEQEPTCARCHQ